MLQSIEFLQSEISRAIGRIGIYRDNPTPLQLLSWLQNDLLPEISSLKDQADELKCSANQVEELEEENKCLANERDQALEKLDQALSERDTLKENLDELELERDQLTEKISQLESGATLTRSPDLTHEPGKGPEHVGQSGRVTSKGSCI